MQHAVGVKRAFDLTYVEDRGFFHRPAPGVHAQITQQNPPAHLGLGQLRFDAKPAFVVRSGGFFDDCEERADNSFGLGMMPLEFLALEFLLATIFQSLVGFLIGNNSVERLDSFNSQAFHGSLLLRLLGSARLDYAPDCLPMQIGAPVQARPGFWQIAAAIVYSAIV